MSLILEHLAQAIRELFAIRHHEACDRAIQTLRRSRHSHCICLRRWWGSCVLCARKSDIPLICRILFWAVIVGPVIRTSVLFIHIDVVVYSFGHIIFSMVAGAHAYMLDCDLQSIHGLIQTYLYYFIRRLHCVPSGRRIGTQHSLAPRISIPKRRLWCLVSPHQPHTRDRSFHTLFIVIKCIECHWLMSFLFYFAAR